MARAAANDLRLALQTMQDSAVALFGTQAQSRKMVAALRQRMRDYRQRTRDIFVLYRIERMKQHEIAALFGLSQSAVEKHLVKAMTYLTERFERP